jgi:hypothetical protein
MHARSVRSHKLDENNNSSEIDGGIQRSLVHTKLMRATRCAVMYLQKIHFSPTHNMNALLKFKSYVIPCICISPDIHIRSTSYPKTLS